MARESAWGSIPPFSSMSSTPEDRRKPLFSLTRKDFRVDHFRSGGPGGQNQNKRETGVRITHEPSGAVGESREERSQLQNQKTAFRRLIESRAFKNWMMATAAAIEQGHRDLDRKVDSMMVPENLLVEEVEVKS